MATYEIVEKDEAGVETGRYVGDVGGGRVDVVVSCFCGGCEGDAEYEC
jgi:hypothetical protein